MSQEKSQSDPERKNKSNAAPKPPRKRRRPRPAFVTLLLLVTISAGYYALYVVRHGDELRDYYLRRLLVSAENAEQEIDRLWHNVERNLESPEKIDLIPAIESNGGDACGELLSKAQIGEAGQANGSVITVAGWDGGDAVLCFSSSADPKTAKLATLLESKLPAEDFDSVLLTRQNGDVLLMLQSHNMVLDIVRLDIEERSGEEGQSADHEQESEPGITLEHTSIGELSFAETTYLAFVQPMRIPIRLDWPINDERANTSTGEQTWYLVGLKESSRFRSEAMAISPTALLLIFSVVVLALFALPYLKLRFIGSREALHRHDVLVLTIALVIATSGITFALLELHMRDTIQQQIDERLSAVADDISGKFRRELQSLDAQLRALTNLRDSQCSEDSCCLEPASKDGTGRARVKLLSCGIGGSGLPLSDYPFFEMVYWMDEDGKQKEKWSVKTETTTLINVKDREYFKDARDLKFTNRMVDPDAEKGWSVESIRSKNTGEVASVLSQRVEPKTDVIVAAAYSPLLSVIEPVLPPGFEFAIIDAQGDVLFHRDPTRNLSENLFEWTNKEDRLRASVLVGNERLTTGVKYRARDYRMYLRPLPGTQWSLVVLYDDLDIRLARVDILTVAFFFYLIYLFALLSMYFFLWWRTQDTPQDPFFVWLWPDRHRSRVYLGYLLIAAINIAAWAVLFRYGSGSGFQGQVEIVVGSSLLGLITLGFAFRLLRLENSKEYQHDEGDKDHNRLRPFGWYAVTVVVSVLLLPDHPWIVGGAVAVVLAALHVITSKLSRAENVVEAPPAIWRGLYLTAVCAVVGVIAILPPFMFYAAAHDEIMELFAKREQLFWSASLAERYDRHLERFGKIEIEAGQEARVRTELGLRVPDEHNSAVRELDSTGWVDLGAAWDIHGAGASWTAMERPMEDVCSAPDEDQRVTSRLITGFAAEWLPGYTAESDELRALAYAGDSPTRCWRNSADANSLVFDQERYRRDVRFGENADPGSEAAFVDLRLSSPHVRFQLPGLEFLPWIIVLLVAVALISMTKNLLRLVYLMDLMLPEFLGGDSWPEGTGRRHALVLRAPHEDAPARENGSGAYSIDASRLETDIAVEKLQERALDAGEDTVRITEFHVGLWDPQVAERKLLLLERLLASGKRLEVHSDINPMHYFVMRSRDYFRGLAQSGPDLGRWSAVLAKFTRCRTKREAKSSRIGLLQRLRQEQPKHGVESTTRALQFLARECSPNPELEEIAVAIVRHPDFEKLAKADDFPEPIINQVLDQAEPYYRLLWSISSKDKRMVLYHVAVHGFVSWRSRDLVHRLCNRGLIKMDPHPKLMNESFWQFVRRAEMPEVLEQWTEEAGASAWARLKGPVAVALVLAIVFLFSTQPQLLRQGMAFTAGLAAMAPALIKLFSMLLQSRIGSGSQG